MGKKLRNRTIYQTQEQESLNSPTNTQIRPLISKSQIRAWTVLKLIKPFKNLNKKAIKFNKRLQSSQINAIIDESKLQCPICLEIMIEASMLICGHMYCHKCLESNSAHSQKCCLCRKEQQNNRFINHKMADKLINKFVQKDTDLTIKYLCRTTDSAQWLKRRKLNFIKQGLIVDYQDRTNLWRRGIITEIKNQEKTLLKIKYFIRGEQLFQFLQAQSRRLAPYTFFTRNKYLQEFPTCLPEFDLYEKELHNLQYKRQQLDEQFFRLSRSDMSSSENEYFQFENHIEQGQNLLNQAFMLFDQVRDVSFFQQIIF